MLYRAKLFIAFAISEYTYELLELADGKGDTELKDQAAKSLMLELDSH